MVEGKVLYLDAETTLNHKYIHCVYTGFSADDIAMVQCDELQGLIDEADYVCGHNLIGFDRLVLDKVWNITIPPKKCIDTLVLSRLFHPNIEGGHSLEVWGEKLNYPKISFPTELFDDGYTDEMGEYCRRDVEILTHLLPTLYRHLEAKRFSQRSIALEHDVAIILAEMREYGFKLDLTYTNTLWVRMTVRIRELEGILQEIFPPIISERYSEKTGKRLADSVEVFNPAARAQIIRRLEGTGVKFTEVTDKNNKKCNETVLSQIDTPEARLITEHLLLSKRVAQINQWLAAVDDDSRIHCRVIGNGAVTGRMIHSKPNLGQVPSVKSAYGPECRQCFTVDEGNVLVGCDASGLELRMLAHYMDDKDYTDLLLNDDIHTYNMRAAGLSNRDQAKTFIYATLYGAGHDTIGAIVGAGSKEGKRIRKQFYENVPGLQDLDWKVTNIVERSQMTLPGLDGRRIRVRDTWMALNTLLQGAGAVVVKEALVLAYNRLKEEQIPNNFVMIVHDEFQNETPKQYGRQVGEIMQWAIREAGNTLNLRCPLDAEFKIGRTWEGTH